MSKIEYGDHVVFRRDKTTRVFKLRPNRQVYYDKQKFNADELIGKPYGSTFELDRGRLSLVEQKSNVAVEVPTGAAATPKADNRNLLDSDSNQKMSKDEIMKLKEDGIKGEKLIEKLIENSETFKTKTEFSQEKFLNKKKKKHCQTVFTVVRPTARLMLDIFSKEPQKLNYLRADSLSQMLNFSNVMYGSNVAVIESCQGLVLACVLQRMGGSGKLIQLLPYTNAQVCRNVMNWMNFPADHNDCVYSFPLDCLSSLKLNCGDMSASPMDTADTITTQEVSSTESGDVSEKVNSESTSQVLPSAKKESLEPDSSTVSDKINGDKSELSEQRDVRNGEETAVVGDKRSQFCAEFEDREKQRKVRAIRHKEAGDIIAGKRLDSLVIACKYNPVPILKKMLPFMSPGRHVVVFCQYIDPLKDSYMHIKQNQLGLQVRLTETWFREYQVLPQRTHPENNMSGTGGYLLTFITAEPMDSKK